MNSRCILAVNCAVAVLLSSAHCLDSPESDGIPVSISRRESGDVYYLNQNNQTQSMACNEGDNTTYLIADGCCISNQTLFDGNFQCAFCFLAKSSALCMYTWSKHFPPIYACSAAIARNI
jgi:hypothetical protein